MSDSLRDDLQAINGVGEKKTEKIVSVIADHGGVFDGQDATDTSEVKEILQDAYDYHQQEDYGFSEQYLREALDKL